jgi:hypothetical protein
LGYGLVNGQVEVALAHFRDGICPGVSGGVVIMMFVIMPGVRS